MNTAELYITHRVRIGNKGIALNGQVYTTFDANIPVAESLGAAYRQLEQPYPKFFKMDLLSKLGWLAVEVVKAGGWRVAAYEPSAVAMVVANQHSSNETDLNYWESTRQVPSPALFVYTLPNIVLGEISIRNGLKGEQAFLIQDAFNGEQLLEYVQSVFAAGNTGACIAGWLDVWQGAVDAFLVIIEKVKDGATITSATQLKNLYNEEIWN